MANNIIMLRIPPELKQKAQADADKLGLSLTSYIKMLIKLGGKEES